MDALGALSTELIFEQTILKEIGLSFLIQAEQTAAQHERSMEMKQRENRKTHEILVHVRFGISETSSDVISQD